MNATLSLPVVTTDEFDDYLPLDLYLPRDLLRRAESFVEEDDGNLGDWIASLVSAALEGQVSA